MAEFRVNIKAVEGVIKTEPLMGLFNSLRDANRYLNSYLEKRLACSKPKTILAEDTSMFGKIIEYQRKVVIITRITVEEIRIERVE